MQLHTIDTGYFKLDGGAMFGVVPKQIWQRTNPADDLNLCDWATRLLLIEDGNKLILVDTGLGDKQDAKFFGHYHRHGNDTLDGSLAKLGYTREDITDVILTHLHFDHCGGAVHRVDDRLRPSFYHATYWSNEAHWKWATEQPNAREKASFLPENILPLQESGQLKFISPDQPNFNAHIQMRFVHGHTESMMLPQIQYQDKTILYMADLLPSVGHIPLPYVMSYDVNPLQTMEERNAYWNEIVDQEYILFLEHDPQFECCTLQRTDKGIRLKDTFKLSEIL